MMQNQGILMHTNPLEKLPGYHKKQFLILKKNRYSDTEENNDFREELFSGFNSKKRRNKCMLDNMTTGTKKYLREKRNNRKKIGQLINEGTEINAE